MVRKITETDSCENEEILFISLNSRSPSGNTLPNSPRSGHINNKYIRCILDEYFSLFSADRPASRSILWSVSCSFGFPFGSSTVDPSVGRRVDRSVNQSVGPSARSVNRLLSPSLARQKAGNRTFFVPAWIIFTTG